MRLPLAIAVVAALGCALPLAAQEPATTHASLDGLTFPVPGRHEAVPAPGDAHLAVFRDPRGRTVVFVATLPDGIHRTQVMARARHAAASAALGREPRALEWISAASFAVSRREVYHDCRIAVDGGAMAVVQLRVLSVAGREVVTGYAFPLSRDEGQRLVSMPMFYAPSPPAAEASAMIVAELAGEPPAKDPPEPAAARSQAGAAEDAAIRAAYAALQAATQAQDHQAVMALIAPPYLRFLEDMHHLALHASAERVRAEPLMNQLYVLDLRHRVPAAQLRTMDTRQLLAHAWDTGWMGTGGWRVREGREAGLNAGHVVVVEGDLAFARPPAEGGARGRTGGAAPDVTRSLQTAFRREGGAWKVDVLPSIALLESVLRMQVERVGGRPDVAPLVVLERLTRKQLESNLWNPPAAP